MVHVAFVIDPITTFNLTEINVTCPTCIRELDRQFDLDIAGSLLDSLQATMSRGARSALT